MHMTLTSPTISPENSIYAKKRISGAASGGFYNSKPATTRHKSSLKAQNGPTQFAGGQDLEAMLSPCSE
jgi:hypothetical protein